MTTAQVGQAAVGAMERGEHRSTYAISGYDLAHAEFYETIVAALGQRTQVPLVPFEAVEDQMAAADREAAEQGLEHGISLRMSGLLRATDLSLDPAPTQSILGYEDDDVPAAIDETLRVVLRDDVE